MLVRMCKGKLGSVRRYLPKSTGRERSGLAIRIFLHQGHQYLNTIRRMLARTLEHIDRYQLFFSGCSMAALWWR